MADNKTVEKSGDLILKLEELMENTENKYGPFMLDELTQRLEKTIQQFHQDVTLLFEQTFDRTKKIDHAVRTAMSSGKTPDLSEISISSVPHFISDNKSKKPNSIKDDSKVEKKKRKFFSRKK